MVRPHRRWTIVLGTTAVLALAAGCTAEKAAGTTDEASLGVVDYGSGLWDQTVVHSIEISYDQDDYDALIDAYLATEDKAWISATVVIDGVEVENVGLKLKGNSSLRGLSDDPDAELSSEHPEDLPWIIDLDKYVDGQNYEGAVELVVRGNSSETALNEAVALDLLEATGLAAEQAIATRVSVNGEEALRLVIENPDDAWMERELEGATALYKAEAGGDYSYRGDDPDDYAEVFDQEAGEDDLEPLISFLQFINDADDATFEAELAQWLDVDAFATYLAFQELIGNSDDIDGPGNNSYLSYDPESGLMTVVSWDLNLALGGSPSGGGRGGGPDDGGGFGDGQGDRGDRAQREQGGFGGGQGGGAGGGFGGGSNVLSERFLDSDTFTALYESELERLTDVLFTSGVADESLDAWTQTLIDGAGDLVSAETVQSEASAVRDLFGR